MLENKGNNAINISKKDVAWKEVHAEFNSRYVPYFKNIFVAF